MKNNQSYLLNPEIIPGTTMFDGKMSGKGFNLNKMCYSFNQASARNEFLDDELAYCKKFNLSKSQIEAIKNKDILKLLDEGGSIYHLAKFAGIFGMNMQDIGAIQTGMTVEEFHEKLRKAGK
ncbi:MAG: Protocatechuate 4,5-dioxygenase alpha chain [Candidatus Celerinatantimonas neptuna]|nr:MAG: Protocatechuate 4,5-dioxygenase alpha chain [Candidatus Celerinatantimonas neptuna]